MTLTLFPVPAFAEGEEMEEASACVCTEAYTEEAVNYDCPVCGAEGAQACACGEETIAADAPESPDDVKEVHTVKDPSSADAGSDADDAKDTDDAGSTDAAHSTYAADTPAEEAAVLNVTYTLNFYLNDGTDKYGQIFNVKNEITITQLPTRDGYDFIGWADTRDAAEAQYQPGTPIIITEGTEKTVYAVWKFRPLETVVVTPPTLPKEVYIGLTSTDDSLKAGGGVAKVKGTDTVVPGKFTFKSFNDGSVNVAGENRLRVHFIPDDQETYAAAECEIIVIGLKHTIAEVRTKISITDKPLGTEFADLGLGKEISFVVSENWDDPADKWVHYTDKVIWDESQYDKDSPYEQTITGTLVLSDWKDYILLPDEPLTLSVKVKLKYDPVEPTIYNPDGDVEYKTDGTSAILTDYTTTLDDYDLRGFGAIFQALQAAGMFTGLDEAGNELDGWYQAYSFANTDRVADISQLTVTGKRVDLHGKIIPKTITITLELGGGELPEGVSSTVTRTYGSWYDLPKPTRHGYSFTYWSTAETGGSEIFPATRIMQTTDHTVYARWKQIAGHSPVREQKPEALAKAATCTENAVYYMSCSCGEIIKTETFTAENTAGHDYGNWTSNHDGTHTGVCSHDAGHTKTEACSGGTATCVKKAVCKVCGKEYGEKDSDNHSGREEWTVTESTHEQKWSCCGKVTVSAEGHSFGEWVVIKRPTYSQQGIRMHTCGSCGYYETESIPATGKTPQTGDDSALGLWSLLMCASFTGVLSLTAFGLRQRTKKKQ